MKIAVTSIYVTGIWKMVVINARRYKALRYEHPLQKILAQAYNQYTYCEVRFRFDEAACR